jgi:acetylornithine/N-succinyldiaminopimelate aminotransferase
MISLGKSIWSLGMLKSQTLLASDRFKAAKKELLATLLDASRSIQKVEPASSPELREAYAKNLQDFTLNRGRDLYFPYLSSGLGSGPLVELADGSVKYDMITGIGMNFFGHSHPAFLSEVIDAATADPMQGNLQPGVEAPALIGLLLSKVGATSKLKRGWITTCGTMANELALKIIRQKNAPATKISRSKTASAAVQPPCKRSPIIRAIVRASQFTGKLTTFLFTMPKTVLKKVWLEVWARCAST